MNIKFLSAAFISVMILTTSFSASASLIEYNDYTLNEITNVVSSNDLEWLQWDETLGLSIDEALAVNQGWRLATRTEMNSLFNDMLSTSLFTGTSNVIDRHTWGFDDTNYLLFLEMIGSVNTAFNSSCEDDFEISCRYSILSFDSIKVLFDSELDNYTGLGYLRQAYQQDNFECIVDQGCELLSTDTNGAYGYLQYASISPNTYEPNGGVALVRAIYDVPEPSTLVIFMLGVVVLASRRFKKQY